MQMNLCYWLRKKKVLQDMIDKVIEIGGCYGMEKNVRGTKVMRI
jgi:hypothetical protein